MPMIDSVDWPNKRVYLHADTVTQGFNGVDAHFEISALTAGNANDEQNYKPALTAEGNFPKGDGTFTPEYIVMRSGWRFVPYSQVSHELQIEVELLSVDGLRDRQLFDRSTVPPGIYIDITPVYEKVEIREVNTGSGLTPEQAIMIMEIWQRQGLDANNMLMLTDSLIQTGAIQLDIASPDESTTTVRRR